MLLVIRSRSAAGSTITLAMGVVAILIAGVRASAVTPSPPDSVIRVTLLGTGSPIPMMDRFGPSVLVEAGLQMTGILDGWRHAA